MAGYLGTRAVLLSTTAADVTGDMTVAGDATVSGAFTSLGIDDNATSTAITIDASENVGIGVTDPDSALEVQSSASGLNSVHLSNTSSAGYGAKFVGGGATATQYIADFRDYAGASKVRIDGSGSLLVGTTTALNNEKFGVDSAREAAQFRNSASNKGTVTTTATHATYVDWVHTVVTARAGGTTCGFFRGIAGTTAHIYIYNNGNIVNSNNSYGAISDVKLKENITDTSPKLDKLNQVRVVNYNLIGQDQKQIGVIAQELEQVFPSMVEESADRDADGNDLGTTTKSVKYSVFVPMLIKAMQEQQVEMDDLKARLTALEVTP